MSRPVTRRALFFLLRTSAFTVLDLITALSLFGIVAAIAIPNWAAQLPTYRLNTAARQIQSELHRIKSQAIAGNTDFRIVFTTSSVYRIEKKIGTYQATGENKALPDGITYGSRSAADITFTPRGTSNSDTIRLCNNKREGKNIIVSGSGRIRIASDSC